MPSGVDESALLDDGWCPALSTGVSPPSPPSPLLNGKAMMRPPREHVVRRLIRSPFAAVLRTTKSRTRAAVSASDEQPSDDGDDTAARGVERRRREERRRPSLEQLLRMNSSRADRKSEPDTTTATKAPSSYGEVSTPSRSHFTVGVSGDERRSKAVPVVKFDACGRRTIANAKRLVVAFESLRSCSRAPGVSVVVPKSKGPDGKVAAAGRATGKPELFYSRPIPMGRRCRVQHLEESPSK